MTSIQLGGDPRSSQPDPVRDVARFLRRGAPWALALAVLAGLVVGVVAYLAPSVYRVQVGVIASPSTTRFGTVDVITPPPIDASVYRSALLEGGLLASALERLDGVPPAPREVEAFRDMVRVRVENADASSLIWISVRAATAQRAADAANVLAEELVSWDRGRALRSLDRSLDALQSAIAGLDAEIAAAEAAGDATRAATLRQLRDLRAAELEAASGQNANALVVGLLEPLRRVEPPERPAGPNVPLLALLGALAGGAGGFGLRALRDLLGSRLRGRADVAEATGLPVLAEFPRPPRRALRLSSEAAGFFRANVDVATRGSRPRVIVVTSALRPEDKSGVSIALAESMARSGQRTLLVDADMRQPGVTEWMDLVPSSTVPLEVYLANPERRYLPVSVALGGRRAFDFVPSFAGTERHPVDLLNEGFAEQLSTWTDLYDVVVLDAPPVVPYADALAIAPSATGVVVCVSAARATREEVEEALALLRAPHVTVLGVALTNAARGRRGRSAATVVEHEPIDAYTTRVPTERSGDGR